MAIMATLRESAEEPALVNEAMKYLRGRLGELRRRKKEARLVEERRLEREAAAAREREAGGMRQGENMRDVMVLD